MVELVDTQDLKSCDHCDRAGSIPASSTNKPLRMKQKILFLDRDGTILKEPSGDFQIDSLAKTEFLPEVIGALRKIAEQTDYSLVMVSNQDGLDTDSFPMSDFLPSQEWMLKTLAGEHVVFDEILIDKHRPEDNSPYRKPAIGMVEKYLNEHLDFAHSYVIGDRLTDMQLAENMGLRGIYIGMEDVGTLPVALQSSSWDTIATFLLQGSRRSSISRKTAETQVSITLDLNGDGTCESHTGIDFFDHMLAQIARHGGVSLWVDVKGDLAVDEHHSIEDTAIVLGQCFREAIGSRKGMERYGFVLPMDEAKATIALDFGGRGCLEWKVNFQREYVGGFPTEMTRHFFASFCQEAACNLNIEASGENTHHLIEAIFKGFARAIRMAVKQTGSGIPSSK
ncbi:histidine biosynthesis bifunctional protein HisB [Bacteroidia bacterium]|nr:histidine biosynthesis bifunctional protein HisB [Bacteroidia bacterium]